MSRNIDKSRTVLSLYQEQQSEYKEYSRYRRPKRVEQVGSLKESLEWYRQTLRDVNSQIGRLYDPSLNEDQLREVTERVNVLIRESGRWARHLAKRFKHKVAANVYGGTVIRGTRYIGRAQELPEVQVHKEKTQRNVYAVDPKKLRTVPKEYYDYHCSSHGKTTELQRMHNVTASPAVDVDPVPSQQEVQAHLVQRRKNQLLQQLRL